MCSHLVKEISKGFLYHADDLSLLVIEDGIGVENKIMIQSLNWK